MANIRLEKIYQEAGRLFDKKGYPNTKMAEIAKAAGIAVGTMYSTFTGKDSVLSFVIYATLNNNYLSNEFILPIAPVEPAKLIAALQSVLDSFETTLCITDKTENITKDFSALMEELFDLFADYLLAFTIIEKNSDTLKELSGEYLPRTAAYYSELEHHLQLYMERGYIRKLTNLSSHVLFLTNTLTWWALNSNLSLPNKPIPRNVAKETCIGIIQRAYQKIG